MPPKYKVTGCARFFFFLIIFIPAVFFGAAFLRGENGVQIIKDFYHSIVGGGDKAGSKAEEKAKAEDTYKVEDLREELRKANDEIESLKKEIQAKDKEIERLKSEK
ncbi:MAG: hypothetical protein KBA14_02315 [Saprospiraceae bacterium]|nr:hypothetical protein [Saprospiraceae bacterium]